MVLWRHPLNEASMIICTASTWAKKDIKLITRTKVQCMTPKYCIAQVYAQHWRGDGEGMAVGAVDMGSIAQAHGPLARYVKLRAAHAPGMPGTFSPPPRVSDPDMHHGTCVTHVPWCMPGSLTSGFLWIMWRGKRSRHSRRMRNPQFYVSGKRPMALFIDID